MINKRKLKEYSAEMGIALDDTALERFDIYADELAKANKTMNLTAITEPDEIIVKHFADSLEILKYCAVPKDAGMIDVGTGAGFPGLPLLIVRNDIKLTLLDSLKKRLTFLDGVLNKCSLDAKIIHARAEDAGKEECLRETFDFATARAVAPLNVLAEYCIPFVKVGGYFAALKGTREDFSSAEQAIKELGGEITDNISYKLPNGDGRSIIIIKKISQTSTIYPRNSKKITVRPL